MHTTIIRPGLLVGLKTTVTGGVRYEKRTIEPEHAVGNAVRATWETTREVTDADDHARAVVARGRARSLITGVCCASSFGLLCPVDREDRLAEAIAEAHAIAAAHNSGATYSRVDVFIIAGRIADDDLQAARAIGAEVAELLQRMESAVRVADPAAIREAANRARSVAGMLGEDAGRKVSAAIAEVRKVARGIVKAAEAGETAATVVEGIKLEALAAARFSVLDLSPEQDTEATPVAGRSVDFEPSEASEMSAGPVSYALDLG